LDGQRSVLIVDPSEENREVLRTVLERRGLRTFAAGRVQPGLELARRHRPDLIVLDLEVDDPARAKRPEEVAEQFRSEDAALVLLGSLRRRKSRPPGEFVAKPYHYGPLVRRIEALLDSTARGIARSA
jgi:DNA-binding NtrC family response regulator